MAVPQTKPFGNGAGANRSGEGMFLPSRAAAGVVSASAERPADFMKRRRENFETIDWISTLRIALTGPVAGDRLPLLAGQRAVSQGTHFQLQAAFSLAEVAVKAGIIGASIVTSMLSSHCAVRVNLPPEPLVEERQRMLDPFMVR